LAKASRRSKRQPISTATGASTLLVPEILKLPSSTATSPGKRTSTSRSSRSASRSYLNSILLLMRVNYLGRKIGELGVKVVAIVGTFFLRNIIL